MSYTKLASSILTSTIWMEDDHTRIVWMALMAMADRNGEVQASIPGLANVARVPLESCRIAIEKFLSPDPYSRTKCDEGRRIEEIQGGWMLINHEQYRNLASDCDRKQKAAERQKRFRERKARNATVTPESRQIPQAEAKADTKAEADLFIGDSKESPPSSGPAIAWTQAEGFQGITDADKQSWAIAYPACDLTRQLAAMNEWLRANPTKAHKRAWRRFITGWLERAQERGGDAKSSPVSHQTKKTTINDYDRPSTWTEEQNAI